MKSNDLQRQMETYREVNQTEIIVLLKFVYGRYKQQALKVSEA
jgi:hypothetical protein